MYGCKKYKKKFKKKNKFVIWLACIFALIFVIALYIACVVNPLVVSVAEAKARHEASAALSETVMSVVKYNDYFSELIKYQYDASGKVSVISVNSAKANLLARHVVLNAQKKVDEIKNAGMGVPSGAFSGIAAISGLGPEIRVSVQQIGTVTATFSSQFESQGINQTVHKIFIDAACDVVLVWPFEKAPIHTSVQVLITETLIVGEIPSTYLQSSYLDEMLNLVPA